MVLVKWVQPKALRIRQGAIPQVLTMGQRSRRSASLMPFERITHCEEAAHSLQKQALSIV